MLMSQGDTASTATIFNMQNSLITDMIRIFCSALLFFLIAKQQELLFSPTISNNVILIQHSGSIGFDLPEFIGRVMSETWLNSLELYLLTKMAWKFKLSKLICSWQTAKPPLHCCLKVKIKRDLNPGATVLWAGSRRALWLTEETNNINILTKDVLI